MSDFRAVPGRSPVWYRTAGTFSNFEFIDTHFGSHPLLRRIFSLARKTRFSGLLAERIVETDCPLLAAENSALAQRRSDFKSSDVTRFSFFAGEHEENPGAFLGYAVFKLDRFADRTLGPVYEAVMAPARDRAQNNFTHCTRTYSVCNSLGAFSVTGVLYAQPHRRGRQPHRGRPRCHAAACGHRLPHQQNRQILKPVMKVSYDPEVDIVRILLSDAVIAESDESKPDVIIDYDAQGNLVGLEVLDASHRISDPRKVEVAVAAG